MNNSGYETLDEEEVTLKQLFPKRKSLVGPYGYILLSPSGNKLDVIVDVKSKRVQHRTEKILNDPNYTLCEDGEYLFRLDFSDKYRALQLVGIRPDRRG